jgi:hypothetical protein
MTSEELFGIGTTIISVVIGGAITWGVAWYYYKRAGDELRRESERLHRTTEIILRWLENGGAAVSVIRDNEGIPAGLNLQVSLSESVHATDSADASVTRSGTGKK